MFRAEQADARRYRGGAFRVLVQSALRAGATRGATRQAATPRRKRMWKVSTEEEVKRMIFEKYRLQFCSVSCPGVEIWCTDLQRLRFASRRVKPAPIMAPSLSIRVCFVV